MHRKFVVMRPGVCTPATHTPVLNGSFKSSHRIYGKFGDPGNVRTGQRTGRRNGGFFVYFWEIKCVNLQNNGV